MSEHHARLAKVAQQLTNSGCDVSQNFPLAPLTTYAVGGSGAYAVTMSQTSHLASLGEIVCSSWPVPLVVFGRGSNTLVSDEGFDGVAVLMKMPASDAEMTFDSDLVTVPGSCLMPVLARRTTSRLRGGLEWCVGIPGTVGGAVRMNAGGHGADMRDSIVSVQVLSLASGVTRDIDVTDLGLHFRGSALSSHHVVLSATFRTTDTSSQEAQVILDDVVAWRREHQPGGRNAGSVFVNPGTGPDSAGALIDSLGLRGLRVGGAQVSDKHANFIQADAGATASDVVAVMLQVQQAVLDTCGVLLRSEVCLVGFSQEITAQFADPAHHSPERQAARDALCVLLGESL